MDQIESTGFIYFVTLQTAAVVNDKSIINSFNKSPVLPSKPDGLKLLIGESCQNLTL
jgi:hypothetical protein